MRRKRITRRKALSLVGGGVVLAAIGWGGWHWYSRTRRPSQALEPWHLAGGYDEPRMRALSYAILAPSPHNLQPWLADLRQPGRIVILRDPERTLPETDPYGRQLTIAMGCFLELLAMALAEDGTTADAELFPDGEDGPVAILHLQSGGMPDPLFRHALDRRSGKEPYEERPVPPEMAAALSSHARIVVEPELVRSLAGLARAAWEVEARTPRTLKENVDLMRFGKAEIEARPDGIALGGPTLEALMAVGALDRTALLDRDSAAFDVMLRLQERVFWATPAFATVVTPGNTRLDQIEAGRRWLRLNLAATGLGLSLHPVSQALQEYRELSMHRRRAHELLAELGEAVQMLGRLGFAPPVPPAPRWPLAARIVRA
ncbi:hypothetical protein [Thalassobaculum sp.]|uniref:Acg family FMN-binding oxidoreductase n=1 Tax=Thalassobaculum sp. TaxID=2022740 RepID=UPI0032EC1E50